jgi:hypothetical protein
MKAMILPLTIRKKATKNADCSDELGGASDDLGCHSDESPRVPNKTTAPKDDQSSNDDAEVLPTPVKKASSGIDRAKRGRKFKTDSPAGP